MKFVVAFSSPKRSARTVDAAAKQAKAIGAELVLLRIIPDAQKVGVVAQLISTDRPQEKAQSQVDEVVAQLKEQGLNASGIVKVGEVAKALVSTSEELKADMLFVGTTKISGPSFFLLKKDPIVHYLVDHCPINLCLIRREFTEEEADPELDA